MAKSTNREKYNWLYDKIRIAAYIGFSFSLFGLLVGALIPIQWSIYTYCAFGIGYISAILLKSRHQPNPLRLSVSRERKVLYEDETLTYLEPFWEVFPRYLYWLPIFPAYLILIIMNLLVQKTITNLSSLFVIAGIGFGVSIFLCDAIYSTYILRTRKK